eukprot:TRINITY_DN22896_c0_g1_i3.p1 TRINITY_DN22896_c0_g1~~TRINITY_DN22896_c0_g1_i3.p1  ORF type:complete len:417 (+),score=72.25 TRINITY_DN22896_c0_g1_i3:95-1345(+)
MPGVVWRPHHLEPIDSREFTAPWYEYPRAYYGHQFRKEEGHGKKVGEILPNWQEHFEHVYMAKKDAARAAEDLNMRLRKHKEKYEAPFIGEAQFSTVAAACRDRLRALRISELPPDRRSLPRPLSPEEEEKVERECDRRLLGFKKKQEAAESVQTVEEKPLKVCINQVGDSIGFGNTRNYVKVFGLKPNGAPWFCKNIEDGKDMKPMDPFIHPTITLKDPARNIHVELRHIGTYKDAKDGAEGKLLWDASFGGKEKIVSGIAENMRPTSGDRTGMRPLCLSKEGEPEVLNLRITADPISKKIGGNKKGKLDERAMFQVVMLPEEEPCPPPPPPEGPTATVKKKKKMKDELVDTGLHATGLPVILSSSPTVSFDTLDSLDPRLFAALTMQMRRPSTCSLARGARSLTGHSRAGARFL